jgi:hypothetical protein
MIDIPDTVTKGFFLNIVNFLGQLFKPVDIFLEIFLIKIILFNKDKILGWFFLSAAVSVEIS